MSEQNQISSMMEEYLLVHKDSKYNNRRNVLRKLADALFGLTDA